ncbi:Aspartyl/asparaginy/proline hydroxylase domain-containing protein [Plasmodiophora brassicae]|nr:hypothetical protein PBRA_004645 [Plasmodiophora brassicae]
MHVTYRTARPSTQKMEGPGGVGNDHGPFYDPNEFDCVVEVASRWKEILEEFRSLDSGAEVHPWPEMNLYQLNDTSQNRVVRGAGWDVFGLHAFGKKKEANCRMCPVTAGIIKRCKVPLTTATFSILRPGVHVLPHSGYVGYSNSILRAHICLTAPQEISSCVPDPDVWKKSVPSDQWFSKSIFPYDPLQPRTGCMFRVDDLQTSWRPGHCLVFDDLRMHEAWNFTSEPRVNLMIDFPRPAKYRVPGYDDDEVLDGLEKGAKYLDKLTSKHGWEPI